MLIHALLHGLLTYIFINPIYWGDFFAQKADIYFSGNYLFITFAVRKK